MVVCRGGACVYPDLAALKARVGANPYRFGEAFARTYYRAMEGRLVRLGNLDDMAGALGVHISELLQEGDAL